MEELSNSVEKEPLLLEIARLQFQKPIENADYYCITLLGNEDGTIEHSVYSQFAGYTNKPRREIRKARFVNPEKLRDLFHELKEPAVIINDEKDLYIFLLIGGHGIIERSLAEKQISDLLQPEICIQSFSKGYLNAKGLPNQKLNHAPTKKVRMNVLKRDNFRCRICGRSPDNYVDIELHVHHILPWGQGGITEEDNLIEGSRSF